MTQADDSVAAPGGVEMKNMNGKILHSALVIFVYLVFGCAPRQTIMIPPRIDLKAYHAIGVIEFSSNARGSLQKFASQQFIREIQSSQPGVRVLELGNEAQVLQSIQRSAFDLEAIKALGKKYHVDSVFIGYLDVTKVKPNIHLSSLLTSMSVEADVEASLSAKLYETQVGATLWTDSARTYETVAHVSISSDYPVDFGAQDPENAYGRLVNALVYRVTRDFRVRYERQ